LCLANINGGISHMGLVIIIHSVTDKFVKVGILWYGSP
jgi:hypothetical protein